MHLVFIGQTGRSSHFKYKDLWKKGKTLSNSGAETDIQTESNSGRQQLHWDLKAGNKYQVACFLFTKSMQDVQCYKSKVKVTLVQALRLCTDHVVYRGSKVIALLFHDSGTIRGIRG
jgi:hypothetical protein